MPEILVLGWLVCGLVVGSLIGGAAKLGGPEDPRL